MPDEARHIDPALLTPEAARVIGRAAAQRALHNVLGDRDATSSRPDAASPISVEEPSKRGKEAPRAEESLDDARVRHETIQADAGALRRTKPSESLDFTQQFTKIESEVRGFSLRLAVLERRMASMEVNLALERSTAPVFRGAAAGIVPPELLRIQAELAKQQLDDYRRVIDEWTKTQEAQQE
jgi:hypothetical protein